MNEAQLVSLAKSAAIDVLQNTAKANQKMVGVTKNVSVKRK
jgi:hypothetical protein